MKSHTLPCVLHAHPEKDSDDSLSMYRALSQIKELLAYVDLSANPELEDALQASFDDLDTMLNAIK